MSEADKAIKILNNGGIIIYPTDTAFGIGCKIDKENAVKRLFALRRRPKEKAVPVLVSSIKMAKDYLAELDMETEGLMKKYWPGALTIVYDCKIDKVPSLVRGGGKTVGIRMPDHTLLLQIIEKVGAPILGSSANLSGEKTPYRFEDLDRELTKLVDCVLFGKTSGRRLASTVVDCSRKPWKIIRQGAVSV